jgi:hypothetical protein
MSAPLVFTDSSTSGGAVVMEEPNLDKFKSMRLSSILYHVLDRIKKLSVKKKY